MRSRMPGWVARADRTDVNVEATLRVSGSDLAVTIIDISEGGCKLRCPAVLPIGQIVQLTIPAFRPSPATVRWSLADVAGLCFV